jgi:hypothetical protein
VSPSVWTITKYSTLFLNPLLVLEYAPPLTLMPHPKEGKKRMIEKTSIYKKHYITPALNKIGLNQQYLLAVLSHIVTRPCFLFLRFFPQLIVISLAGTTSAG